VRRFSQPLGGLIGLTCLLVSMDAKADLLLVPQPKSVIRTAGQTKLGASWRIRVVGGTQDFVGEADLVDDIRQMFGWRLQEATGTPGGAEVVIRPREPFTSLPPLAQAEGYELRVERDSVVIAAPSAAGRFYGVQTLRQLLRGAPSGELPRVRILDYPELAWRGVSDDISRGQVSTLADFRATLSHLAYYKCNLYCLYIEDAARFWSAPEIGANRDALTPGELGLICQEAARHHIAVMPIFETLGHQERLLSLPTFRRFADLPQQSEGLATISRFLWTALPAVASALNVPDPDVAQQEPSCFSPVSPAARARVIGLIDELAGFVPSPFFHLGGDEPSDVGKGSSGRAVRAGGFGAVYAAYEMALADHVRTTLGRQPVLFADVLLKEPDALSHMPRDVAVMDWDYNPETSGSGLERLRAAGFSTIFGCAGLWNWFGIYPDYSRAFPNIERTVQAAARTRASGVVTASWCDGGAEALRRSNWPGYAFGADASWSGTPSSKSFLGRFASAEYGTTSPSLRRAEELLGWHTSVGNMYSQRVFYRPIGIRAHSESWIARMEQMARDMAEARRLLSAATRLARFNKERLDVLDHAAARLEYASRRELLMESLARTTEPAASDRAQGEQLRALCGLRDSSAALANVYSRLWRRDNRPACLEAVLARLHGQKQGLDSLITLFDGSRAERGRGSPAQQTPKPGTRLVGEDVR